MEENGKAPADLISMQAEGFDALNEYTKSIVWDDWPHDMYVTGKVMLVVPTVPKNAPKDVKEALMARRMANLDGHCLLCEASFDMGVSRIDENDVKHSQIRHENDCNVGNARLHKLISKYGGLRQWWFTRAQWQAANNFEVDPDHEENG